MNGGSAQILVVEDEDDIRELIGLHLRRAGYEVAEAADGEAALPLLGGQNWDLIVLDWMLPGMSGLEILKRIRSEKSFRSVPVLMVTAKGETEDIVTGLEAGADDYLAKPFEVPVLQARAQALLRRSHWSSASRALPAKRPGVGQEEIRLGPLRVRPDYHEAYCGENKIQLTPSEFKLLLALVQSQGRVLTRNTLIDLVQGEGVQVVDRAIDTHIFGLRKKLGECAAVVETVRGVGYRVKSDASLGGESIS